MCLNMLFLFEKILYNSICERLRYFYFAYKRRIKKGVDREVFTLQNGIGRKSAD